MDSLLKKSASTELEDLIQYVNKCKFDISIPSIYPVVFLIFE